MYTYINIKYPLKQVGIIYVCHLLTTYLYLGRRIDGLDNKLQGQEQSQRNMMDQMMKLSQELKVCIKVTYTKCV